MDKAAPPLLLVGGGGEEGRLARTDGRDERENVRLAGVRIAQHRVPELDCPGASRQPCSPVSPRSHDPPTTKKARGKTIPTGSVARPPSRHCGVGLRTVCATGQTVARSLRFDSRGRSGHGETQMETTALARIPSSPLRLAF